MSPRERSSVVLQRLLLEVDSDRRQLDKRASQIRSLRDEPSSMARSYAIAALLTHYYGAIEAILVRARIELEGDEPRGADWHQELLTSMTRDLPDFRPALLSAATAAGARRLLGFRHFFRHAYGADLDEAKLIEHVDALPAFHQALSQDLERFVAELRAALEKVNRAEPR